MDQNSFIAMPQGVPSHDAVAHDFLLWCTGVKAAPWLAASVLPCDERGFVRVDGHAVLRAGLRRAGVRAAGHRRAGPRRVRRPLQRELARALHDEPRAALRRALSEARPARPGDMHGGYS